MPLRASKHKLLLRSTCRARNLSELNKKSRTLSAYLKKRVLWHRQRRALAHRISWRLSFTVSHLPKAIYINHYAPSSLTPIMTRTRESLLMSVSSMGSYVKANESQWLLLVVLPRYWKPGTFSLV